MKHIIVLGDGMADHAVARIGGRTPLQFARKPYMDRIARDGRCGMLVTVPEGFVPGSEVANTAILGYDLHKVYEGRGPLEAASIGYEMSPEDMAIRCNLITIGDGRIITHNGGNISTEDARVLLDYLNRHLSDERVRFVTGIQYRHLLVVRGGSKHIVCCPPHDHPDELWEPLLVMPEPNAPREEGRMSAEETAALLNSLILASQELLSAHPYNKARAAAGLRGANSIWPWSGGYRPSMKPLREVYPSIRSGSAISAVDLIHGIGHYAGLDVVHVEGATGLADTNYEGKAAAAIDALRRQDFVFVHVEATDEAGHDGDLELKIRAIEYLDRRLIAPIYEEVAAWSEPVCMAVLPDHPTPVEQRVHVSEPVPFAIWHRGMHPDKVRVYDEISCQEGSFGLLKLQQFMDTFMAIR